MLVSYNANDNKTKYITPTLSSICCAEYPTFVNHMIANAFSMQLLTHYTYIYLVFYSYEPEQARYARISFVL